MNMPHSTKAMDDDPKQAEEQQDQIPVEPTPPRYRRTSMANMPAHAEHGPLIDHKIPQEEAVRAQPDLLWSRIRHFLREPFSEFFGVFILILFGDGVVAQVVLSDGTKETTNRSIGDGGKFFSNPPS